MATDPSSERLVIDPVLAAISRWPAPPPVTGWVAPPVQREVYRWMPHLGGWVYKGVRRG